MNKEALERKDLPKIVAQVQSMLVAAEGALKTVSQDIPEDSVERYEPEAFLSEYEKKAADIDFYYQTLSAWNGHDDFSVCQQSEIILSLNQLRRLTIVTKNLLRILREELNIPDTERMQEEMQLQMMRMSVLHK